MELVEGSLQLAQLRAVIRKGRAPRALEERKLLDFLVPGNMSLLQLAHLRGQGPQVLLRSCQPCFASLTVSLGCHLQDGTELRVHPPCVGACLSQAVSQIYQLLVVAPEQRCIVPNPYTFGKHLTPERIQLLLQVAHVLCHWTEQTQHVLLDECVHLRLIFLAVIRRWEAFRTHLFILRIQFFSHHFCGHSHLFEVNEMQNEEPQ
mmetsp:Transcript_59731/g.107471  ORF Transcript_59731/g.107471 Transcript_59731/m.107471 type:complete len:205 (-) Transcript_59731:44-658(-)